MEKGLVALCLFMVSLGTFAQTTNNGEVHIKNGEVLKIMEAGDQPNSNPDIENVFDIVEEMPQFPGGPDSLKNYLRDNIKYPVVAQMEGIQGCVVVESIVECDGSLTNIKVVRSVDPLLDKEAIRVVKSMPRWVPGKQNGSLIRVRYLMPITFHLY